MQKQYLKYILLVFLVAWLLSSCKSSQPSAAQLYNPVEVNMLSQKLHVSLSNVSKDDDKNMPLYAESSLWLGVRYKYGGNSKKGVDCSGLVFNIYRTVYNKKIPRSSGQLCSAVKNISKSQLYVGDLVFFGNPRNKGKVSHVGIYLKDGYFIHASTSSGVIVSNLNENYYKKNWVKGGRLL